MGRFPGTREEDLLGRFYQCIDFTDPDLQLAALVIALTPAIWNALGWLQYNKQWISRACGNSTRAGCYLLAVWIFSFSVFRDVLFVRAIDSDAQRTLELLGEPEVVVAASIIGVAAGAVLLGSYAQLGITGTYLGDYFGFLMDEKVTGFPFNISSHPMYDASTALFLVKAILSKSPAGIALSVWVYVIYQFFSHYFEGPFTDKVYRERALDASSKKTK